MSRNALLKRCKHSKIYGQNTSYNSFVQNRICVTNYYCYYYYYYYTYYLRSPYLTLLDFYLQSRAKELVYKNTTETEDQLWECIQNGFTIISNTNGRDLEYTEFDNH